MGMFMEILFGKRERKSLLVTLPVKLINGMDTLMYLHNSKSHELDHITHDEIVEKAVEYLLRQTLKVKYEEDKVVEKPVKRRNDKPVYIHHYDSHGRYQSR